MSGLLAKAVKNGQFVVTADCRPPRGVETQAISSCASAIGGSVHALYAPESEDGVRMSSLAACSHIASAGAEPILALLTRDQNRIALQSTLLGAASMGVTNILCTTGRHQTLTTSGTAKGVFDVDPIQTLQIADAIRKAGLLADGQTLEAPVEFVLGTTANPFADPVELQVLALDKAVAAGADFVITHPVFNLDKFNIWMTYVRERGIHQRTCIVASVMPITSAREAVRLAETYQDLEIGDDVAERLESVQDTRTAGMHMAAETAAYLRKVDGVRGVHLMTGDDYKMAAGVLREAGLSRG